MSKSSIVIFTIILIASGLSYLSIRNKYEIENVIITYSREEYYVSHHSCTPYIYNTTVLCPVIGDPTSYILKTQTTPNMCKSRELNCTMKILEDNNTWNCVKSNNFYCKLEEKTMIKEKCFSKFGNITIPCNSPKFNCKFICNLNYIHQKVIYDKYNTSNFCINTRVIDVIHGLPYSFSPKYDDYYGDLCDSSPYLLFLL
jgi:hypothetical protein